ncbi:MAG TPA: hypothetical protein VL633_13440 [Bacteroidota bacterium]|nr:hypothetical protein [Bacteroidota bacterium]
MGQRATQRTVKNLTLFLPLVVSFMTFSCYASTAVNAQFDSLQQGMTISQITSAIGSPDHLVGELTTAYGQRVVVWEYEKVLGRFLLLPADHTTVWIYLLDGTYLKYTPRGDWKSVARELYRTNFTKPS